MFIRGRAMYGNSAANATGATYACFAPSRTETRPSSPSAPTPKPRIAPVDAEETAPTERDSFSPAPETRETPREVDAAPSLAEAITNFARFTQKKIMVVHQKDPHIAAAFAEAFHDAALVIALQVHHQLFVGFFAALFGFMDDHFRPGDRQFVSFPSHCFDQDRQVQFAAARNLEAFRILQYKFSRV
mgnify:CR=1 FL=1